LTIGGVWLKLHRLANGALIETCSRGITLYPGDVIATGTAAGVGMA